MSGQEHPTAKEQKAARQAAQAADKAALAADSALAVDDAPVRRPATPDIARAHLELLAARKGLGTELDGLTTSTKAALDIPAKVRGNPLRSAALAGGAGFLILGGPKRVLRFVGRALPSRRRDPYEGLLPTDVEKILRDTGLARDPRVREALDRDFADYLQRKGKLEPQPNARASLWRTYDSLVGPLGTVGARMLVERLFAADQASKGVPAAKRPGAAGGPPRA